MPLFAMPAGPPRKVFPVPTQSALFRNMELTGKEIVVHDYSWH